MLEKKIEEHLCKRVKEAGGLAIKFTSPQRARGVIDSKEAIERKMLTFVNDLLLSGVMGITVTVKG